MKRLFVYMTMMLAVMTMTTSCKKDDNGRSAEDVAKSICATGWQGYNQYQVKEMGGWVDRANHFQAKWRRVLQLTRRHFFKTSADFLKTLHVWRKSRRPLPKII